MMQPGAEHGPAVDHRAAADRAPAPSSSGAQLAALGRAGGAQRLGCLPSTTLSWITQPSPMRVPSWMTTLAPISTSSPMTTSSPRTRFWPRRSRPGPPSSSAVFTGRPPSRRRSPSPPAPRPRERVAAVAARRAVARRQSTKCWHSMRSGSRADLRDVDVAEAHRDVLAVGLAGARALGALVVDGDLALGLHVVEDDHLLRADDGHLADLVRVEPAQVQVADDAGREPEVAEDHVLDAGLQVALAAGADLGGLVADAGRGSPRCRAGRGSRARSRRCARCRGSGGWRRGSRPGRARRRRSAPSACARRGGTRAGGRPSARRPSSAVASRSSASAAVSASGFSTKTCLPASRASCRARSGWAPGSR